MNPNHRIALEPRSGIWLLFYETREVTNNFYKQQGYYKQQLIRIFGHRINSKVRFDTAKRAALFVIADRGINTPLIIRDDSQRNVTIRRA